MKTVVIAIGSNLGDRHQHLQDAVRFLSELSAQQIRVSPFYLTEPVGPSDRFFLNGVIELATSLPPKQLLPKLKNFEQRHGRPSRHPRWGARTIDLDIISYGHLVIRDDSLIIPHPEYQQRLFVLKPLQDLYPNWTDPKTQKPIALMIEEAPKLQLRKTLLGRGYGK